jgi:dTDP-4-dehydrorhamnose reductase
MNQDELLIIGAGGQLGTALRQMYQLARAVDADKLDITDAEAVESFAWNGTRIILNAAAYTNVDGAETPEGRIAAWKVNAEAAANLANIARKKDFLLVHVSTDYVFDGTKNPHTEDEPLSPLNVYGASKAAGDLVINTLPKHYILRTSFVIGEGKNFVRIMLELGKKGVNPAVIADQLGRVTFAGELARAIDHLLSSKARFGTYNVSNGGEPASWAGLTRAIFEDAGMSNTVTDTTTAEYYKDKPEAADRPLNSVFDLSKIEAAGFTPRDWREELKEYINKELKK